LIQCAQVVGCTWSIDDTSLESNNLACIVAQIDTFITTLGVHTVFRNNSVLTAAVEFPLSGPEPFSTEFVLQFNYHF